MDPHTIIKDPTSIKVPLNYVEFAEVDDIWIRAYTIEKAKTSVAQHVHEHDHMTLVAQGQVEGWQDGESMGIFTAPAIVKIPAGKQHGFTALTDNVVLCCLHNLRGTGLETPGFMDSEG